LAWRQAKQSFAESRPDRAKLNDINPQAWLAELPARIADHPASRLHELLPWHWKATHNQAAAD
jgi:transposase